MKFAILFGFRWSLQGLFFGTRRATGKSFRRFEAFLPSRKWTSIFARPLPLPPVFNVESSPMQLNMSAMVVGTTLKSGGAGNAGRSGASSGIGDHGDQI